jgi:metal-responsive CopG/Arc/MetJ family transcriptional regulator
MSAQKLSISIHDDVLRFVEGYRKRHAKRTRSEVFMEALRLLESREAEAQLEAAYAQSAHSDRVIAAEFKASGGDGLEDEAW